MKEKIIHLTNNEISFLSSNFEVLTFLYDFDFVYEKQVPTAGVVLLDGQIEIRKNNKTVEIINTPQLLGSYQLLSHSPVRYGCRVRKNSQIILLGKADLNQLIKDKKSKIAKTVRELGSLKL